MISGSAVFAVVAILVGSVCILMAFFGNEVRPALTFGHGPSRPPTLLDRVLFFVGGAAFLASGLYYWLAG
jgi:hypothetical protein